METENQQQPSSIPPVKQTEPVRRNRGWFFLVSFILLLSILSLGYVWIIHFTQNKLPQGVVKQTTLNTPVTPTTGQEVVLRTVIHSPLVTLSVTKTPPSPEPSGITWQPYGRGQSVTNVGLSINYPQGWIVRFRNDAGGNYPPDMAVYRLEFDFLPPGIKADPQSVDWMGWGSMMVDVSDKSNSIDHWLNDNLPGYQNDLVISENTVIGNKLTYYLTPKESSQDGFAPRYVVLGTNYSYVISFSQNGMGNFEQQLEKDIFPTMVFN